MRQRGLKLVQFTDTHIFADASRRLANVDTQASFLATRDKALAEAGDCDLILITGDVAAEAEHEAYTWLTQQLAVFDAPVYCLPGNHDIGAVMQPIVNAVGWAYGGNPVVAGWHIVLLDSCVADADHGRLSEAEIARLNQALTQHRALPTLVCLHHHPVPMVSAWMDTMQLTNRETFGSVVEQHPQVRGVLWGHVHQNFDSYRAGIRLLASPSTCVQFAARSTNFAIDALSPGFRCLQLFADGSIETDIVRL